ncbi:UDP-4-amino-4,6-dideoxy-N-acetyl-beta-L-altrosamine transaminase [Thiomicrorhabdus sp. Milos-T2]|uniref:UDP-4-amino-4, 6-dideoxy-N-acetyl-beta-L-altrosamine transaminase n=1 Tax=Thiomicrorhabdus sp. Milos-T2 TaxID=90814 RepID=UPI000493BC83|nr:UDP-4-amino-4,6-dideoxy-N-acetyl-beta-L-altrosamine transaminase [Thiomicrorhabdus sp. Milos-T2]
MKIPYGRQSISQSDIDEVVKVLESDFLTQGPNATAFEANIVQYCGAQYGVAVNSATSALHIACLALGLGKDDWLWTSPITFVASANVGRLCGAQVDFVDIDSQTYNLCPLVLEEKLKKAQQQNKLPKVVMPVHFGGQSCDMQAIYQLSKKYGFYIIEDASHAIGASYLETKVGSCRFSDITVFSFHPVKIITTGEGGLAATNDSDLANKMRLYGSHGISRTFNNQEDVLRGGWFYEQIELGLNYRMTEMQAALGLSQLTRLDEFVKRRHEIAHIYYSQLQTLPVVLPKQISDSHSSFHLYPIQLLDEEQRRDVFNRMRAKQIGVHVHYIPVHTQPYYQQQGFKWGDFPNAENYYKKALSIPIHQSMTDENLLTVIQSLKECIQ